MATEYLNNKSFEKNIAVFQQSKREKIKYSFLIEDLKESESKKISKNICTEREQKLLEVNLAAYQNIVVVFGHSQHQLAVDFRSLSENLVRYAKFNLIDFDDAIQEGVMICFEKIDRFNPTKGKAFNYMTTCIFNHLKQLYRSARNYNEFKKRYHEIIQNNNSKTLIKNGKEVHVNFTEN